MALLTFGEGWHNNHHAHPTSARHGLAWYDVAPNWMGIRALQAMGLAWDHQVAEAWRGRGAGDRRSSGLIRRQQRTTRTS